MIGVWYLLLLLLLLLSKAGFLFNSLFIHLYYDFSIIYFPSV